MSKKALPFLLLRHRFWYSHSRRSGIRPEKGEPEKEEGKISERRGKIF
jgi:hypothetical protein